ncbi:hypothetical protein LCGC14_0776320 [marine sediment metagenome]|uniref:Uncharacterized protein n=1 Tax=marine sediment metagenome TaxID=412755 RepID=A0A0F9Q104_9ZZZZ
MASRKKTPPNARPDIFDVVTGVTEDDLERTDARIAETVERMKDLRVQEALLMLQREAQGVQLNGVNTKVATATFSYNLEG